MDTINNFKRLAAEDQAHTPHAPKEVEQQVMGTVKTGHFVGDVLELYFSRMINLIMMIFGQKNNEEIPLNESEDSTGEVR